MPKRKKVLLIDVDDNKLGNLAIMKWSAFCKRRGDEVWLNEGCPNPNEVYISCSYSWNAPRALSMASMYSAMGCDVHVGGYGVNDAKLPPMVEHILPDYDLYGLDYSLGFTSRGCPRKCPWCTVPKMEGDIRDHAPIKEFLDPRHEKVILLDNNFLASPKWKENMEFLVVNRLQVNFHQGLDIRLVDDEKANWLRLVKAYNWHFTDNYLHFSFDNTMMEKAVRRGVEILRAHGVRHRLMFYFLIGYGEHSPEEALEDAIYRFNVIRELDADPYPMLYRDYSGEVNLDPVLVRFARWANPKHGIYKVIPWEKYDPSHSWKKWKEKRR